MIIETQIETMQGLIPLALDSTHFTELAQCPVCSNTRWIDVSVLEQSLITAYCLDCSHVFHRRRPTWEWLQDWYQGKWDTGVKTETGDQAAEQSKSRHTGGLRTGIARKLIRPLKLLTHLGMPRGIGGKMAAAMQGSSIFSYCREAINRESAVLDIGCGYGQHLAPFGVLAKRICAIEASEHRSRYAQQQGIETLNIPVEKLSQDSFQTQFDLVFSNHVLEHVADPKQFLEALQRVVKPGGYICLIVPNVRQYFLVQDFFFGLHLHAYTLQSLRELVIRHGFIPVKQQENQELRILARRPKLDEGNCFNDRGGFPFQCDFSIQPEILLERVLGKNYLERQGREHYCKWHYSGLLHETISTTYDLEREPVWPRSLRWKWTETPSLPFHFRSPDGGPVSFLVK